MLKANWKPTKWHGIDIEAGQFATSLSTLADETQLTVQQVRTSLDHLISTGELTSFQQGKTRIITVNNWSSYQGDNKVSNKKVTRCQQDGNKITAPNIYIDSLEEREEGEELKNINTPYNPPRYYPNDEKLDSTFADYVAMRKQLKKPMSDKAVELAIKKLNNLSGGDNDKAIAILEQSIMNSWQGLFELKEETPKPKQSNQGSIDWSKV